MKAQLKITHLSLTTKAMTTKIQPQDMAAYLDSVRPMMEDIHIGDVVKVFGISEQLKVLDYSIGQCIIQVRISAAEYKWIRVEQIEYVYPY